MSLFYPEQDDRIAQAWVDFTLGLIGKEELRQRTGAHTSPIPLSPPSVVPMASKEPEPWEQLEDMC